MLTVSKRSEGKSTHSNTYNQWRTIHYSMGLESSNLVVSIIECVKDCQFFRFLRYTESLNQDRSPESDPTSVLQSSPTTVEF